MAKLVGSLVKFAIITLGAFLVYCYFTKQGMFTEPESYENTVIRDSMVEENVAIGGDFSLINQDGQRLNSSDFKDKYKLVFFGFSACKKICPMNLSIISEALSKLDENSSNKLQTFFITVDPERDNVEKLKWFQEQFDYRIQMLTGTKEKIDEVISKYKVYVDNVGGEEEINHSSIMYLTGPDGGYVTHFTADLNSDENQSDELLNKIRKYVG